MRAARGGTHMKGSYKLALALVAGVAVGAFGV